MSKIVNINLDGEINLEVLFFNTGRQYSKEGQRIVATRFQDGVLFYDMDRHIDGFIRCPLNKGLIMMGYDNGKYGWGGESSISKMRLLKDKLVIEKVISD